MKTDWLQVANEAIGDGQMDCAICAAQMAIAEQLERLNDNLEALTTAERLNRPYQQVRAICAAQMAIAEQLERLNDNLEAMSELTTAEILNRPYQRVRLRPVEEVLDDLKAVAE